MCIRDRVYSLLLDPEMQGEVSHRYILGLYEFMEKLTQAYPHILFESCSGGGGRYDCLLYTSPSPRDRTRSRMPSSA